MKENYLLESEETTQIDTLYDEITCWYRRKWPVFYGNRPDHDNIWPEGYGSLLECI